jgi:hypothetical protein
VAVGTVLYAFLDGPDLTPLATAEVTDASLTGPNGPVPFDAYGSSAPTGIAITPNDRLQQFTTYTATISAEVTPEGGGTTRTFTKTWSFTTGGLENLLSIEHVLAGSDGTLGISAYTTAPNPSFTATGPGSPQTGPLVAPLPWPSAMGETKLDRRGTWHVCVRSGGPGTDYRLAEKCVDVIGGRDPVPPPPPAPPAAPKPAPLLTFAPGARARLTGRTLAIPLRCAAVCRLSVRGTITAGGRRVTVPPTTKRGDTRTTAIHLTLSRALAARVRRAKQRKVALAIAAGPATGKVKTYKKTLAIR